MRSEGIDFSYTTVRGGRRVAAGVASHCLDIGQWLSQHKPTFSQTNELRETSNCGENC